MKTATASAHIATIFALGIGLTAFGFAGNAQADGPRIKAEIAVTSDAIRLGDLIDGLPRDAEIAVFRAPQPGQRGTIRADRIIGAAAELGIQNIDAAGITAVSVNRPARTISRADMEASVSQMALERGIFGDLSVLLDDHLSSRLVDQHRQEAIKVTSFNRDQRNGRFEARLTLPGGADVGDSWVVTGSLVETRDVAVPVSDLDRTSAIEAKDLMIVKRPVAQVSGDIIRKTEDLVGMMPRKPIRAGEYIRQGDIAKPILVEKQATVTVIYAGRGLMISMRGKSIGSGTMGDSVKVQNPQSKRIVEGTVSGPNQVTISAPFTPSLADASQSQR